MKKVFCLPEHDGQQNPYYFRLRVWPTRQAAEQGFRAIGRTWSRGTVGCFVLATRKNHFLGTAYILAVNGKCPLDILTHELVHVAEEFAARHDAKFVEHCPYFIGDSREECVAYVTGYLTAALHS